MARFAAFTLFLLSAAALLSSPASAADRKLLQQVNVPITVQCINLLDNDQIANIPNLNLGVIQAIAGIFGNGQTPVALFWNGGSAENHCSNNQEFNNTQNCGSVVGPVFIPVLGLGYVIPCYGSQGGRKLLQQVNLPVTAQCLNVLDNDQILNVPNADVQIIGAIVSALGAAGQAPKALFLSCGSAENKCSNEQSFSNYQSCGSVIGPVLLPIGGEAFFTPCYGEAGNKRKLLQQVNAPITVQCINLLDNSQIANIPNLNAGIVQGIVGVLGTAQQPTALFFNSGTSNNQCSNNQEFNNQQKCGSVIGPIIVPVLGVGSVIPCYN